MSDAVRRQFVNAPEAVVDEALEGLVLAHPDLLVLDPSSRLVSRRTRVPGKVGLVSGGGSGHEPLHAGFVGTGMLDVAVCGSVFASPTAAQVHAGTVLADGGAGVVQIVKNYTGDVLNFQIAAELSDGEVETESVLVDDDLASEGSGAGRRGTAATLVVEKVCGALAEAGAGLTEIARRGRDVVARSRSLAVALDAGAHPGESRPAFELPPGDVEFGVGIHGERGTARIPFAAADELTEGLAAPLVDALGLARGGAVIAVVNGLGAATGLELGIITRRLHHYLGGRGVAVARTLCGSYVTSLDMHGVSITLTAADDELLTLWDAPVRTPGLTW